MTEIEASGRAFEWETEARRQRLEQATEERGPKMGPFLLALPPELRAALLAELSSNAYREIMDGAEAERAEAERRWLERLAADYRQRGFRPSRAPLPSERRCNSRRRAEPGKQEERTCP